MMFRLLSLTAIIAIHIGVDATNYYIDSNKGDDENSGLLPEKAWASLIKVNNTSFNAGDSILFKSGGVWNGQLLIEDKGTAEMPVVYSSYGEGTKPRIDGQGQDVYTIKLSDASYTTFSNFDITNTGATSQAGRLGVYITAMNGDIPGIVLKDCDIHDVNGEVDKNLQSKTTGAGFGIYWSNKGSSDGRLVDALIQGCHIYRCERNGMGGAINRNVFHLRLTVRQNLIEQVPGDAIIMNTCENSIAEYNIARDFPRTLPESNAAAGIWPFNSKNTIIQYNEVSGHQAYLDGQGFDSDFWCENTIIQYNYSHDNAGGFLLICGSKDRSPDGESSPNKGTIVRYNISINDGGRTWGEHAHDFPLIYFHGNPEGTMIYNNTLFYGNKMTELNGTAPHMIKEIWGEPWSTSIFNNIFASQMPGAKIDMRKNKNTIIDNNLYYNVSSIEDLNGLITDVHAIKANPMFMDKEGFTPEYYRLQEGSPGIKAGRIIPNNGGLDFFGNSVSEVEEPNIGADNYSDWVGIFKTPAHTDLFSAYPGVSADSFCIEVKKPLKEVTLKVTTLTGQTIRHFRYSLLPAGKQDVNLTDCRAGMYIVSLESEGEQQSKKIIKL